MLVRWLFSQVPRICQVACRRACFGGWYLLVTSWSASVVCLKAELQGGVPDLQARLGMRCKARLGPLSHSREVQNVPFPEGSVQRLALGVQGSLFVAAPSSLCPADSHCFPKGRGPGGAGRLWASGFRQAARKSADIESHLALNKAEPDARKGPSCGACPAPGVSPVGPVSLLPENLAP